MSYTVIGAGGEIGARVVAALQARGDEVFAPPRDNRGLFDRPLGRVIYCAGLTADYARRPFDTVRAHSTLLADVLELGTVEALVYLSSTRLYDTGTSSREDAPLTLSPGNPRHIYDLSKALGESLCLTTAPDRARVARLSCVYSDDHDAAGFLPQLVRAARRGADGPVDTSPDNERDYVHVDDVVAAVLALADGTVNGIVNVASGENVSNRALLDVITRAGVALSPTRGGRAGSGPVIDITRLTTELGIRPRSVLTWLALALAPRSSP